MMNTLFSPLRASSVTDANSPMTVLKQYRPEQAAAHGKHAEVFIVSNGRRKPSDLPSKNYAMKRQVLHHKDSAARAQRERTIFETL